MADTTVVFPPELLQLITLAITFSIGWLVTAGAKGLAENFGLDFGKYVTPLVALISTSAVSLVSGLIDMAVMAIPASAAPMVNAILGAIVAILGAMGIQRQLKQAK